MDDWREESVTAWLPRLGERDERAAARIWDCYFERLVDFARGRLGQRVRRTADGEDVALSAIHSLCRGAAEGRFARLEDSNDVWQLLVTIARRKAIERIRHEGRAKRGGYRVRGESVFLDGDEVRGGLDQAIAEELTPEFSAVIDEECQRLMALLGSDAERDVARLRMEGYSNPEIAEELELSLRSVERKVALVRTAWRGELEGAD